MGGPHQCPDPPLLENATQAFIGQLTFYRFNVILGGTATAFVCLSNLLLIFLHATHFSNPAEQAKIIKITYLVPLYAIFSYICICSPLSEASLAPWTEFFQSICVGTFFLLLCEMVSPHENQRDLFFAALDKTPSQWTGKMKALKEPGEGLVWFRRKWIGIFQYPPVALLVAIITDATDATGVYCKSSYKPVFAHLWLFLISNASVTIAVASVLVFYQSLKDHLAHHRPLAKLLAFKLVIFIVFIQTILWFILEATNSLKPSLTLTWADLSIGIFRLLICLEMVPISIFFHYAYPWRPYVLPSPTSIAESGKPAQRYVPTSYQGGFLGYRAILAGISPMEVIQAIMFATTLFSKERRHEPVQNGERMGMEPLKKEASESSQENGERVWPGAQQQQHQQERPEYWNQQGGTVYQPASDRSPQVDPRPRVYQPPGQHPESPAGPLNTQIF